MMNRKLKLIIVIMMIIILTTPSAMTVNVLAEETGSEKQITENTADSSGVPDKQTENNETETDTVTDTDTATDTEETNAAAEESELSGTADSSEKEDHPAAAEQDVDENNEAETKDDESGPGSEGTVTEKSPDNLETDKTDKQNPDPEKAADAVASDSENPVPQNEQFAPEKSDFLAYDPLYAEKYADPEYVSTDDMRMSQFVNIVTAAKGIATYNIKKQGEFEGTADNFIGAMNYEIPVYNIDENSQYYIAIPNVNKFNSNFRAYDLTVAYNNDYAEKIEGCIYKSGIVYIPKSAVDSPSNKHEIPDNSRIAIQLNYAIGNDMDFSKTIPVQILSGEEPVITSTKASNIFDLSTLSVDTGIKGRKTNDITVHLNGQMIPVNPDAWTYDAHTGEIIIQAMPGVVSGVNVVFRKQDIGDKARDAIETAFNSVFLTANANAFHTQETMGYMVNENGQLVTLTVDTSSMFVGWRGSYQSEIIHGNKIIKKKIDDGDLPGFESSMNYLYGGYTDYLGRMEDQGISDAERDQLLVPLWSVQSYAIGADARSSASYNAGPLTYDAQVTQYMLNSSELQTHTIYEWMLYYSNTLEITSQTIVGNNIGGSNNFAAHWPVNQVIAGSGLSLTPDQKANESIVFETADLDASAWYAASCSELGDAAESDGGNNQTIYVTCLGLTQDYIVLAFVQTNTGKQNMTAIYKFKIQPKSGFLTMEKQSAFPDITSPLPEFYSLSGAVYGVYTDEACTAAATDINGNPATFTTDPDGKTGVLEMTPATYFIKEISSSEGFETDTNVYPVEVTQANTADSPAKIVSTEQPKWAYVRIRKEAVKTYWDVVKECPDSYSLAGAVYNLYSDAACTRRAMTRKGSPAVMTTAADGQSNILEMIPGTYYAKETTASKGFFLDANVNSGKAVSLTLNHTEKAPYTVSSREEPKRAYVSLTKKQAQTETDFLKTAPNNYTLKGAVYKVYKDKECTKEALDFNGKPAVFTTGADGKTNTLEMLPLTYYVREVTASKGYTFDKEVKTIKLSLSHTKDSPLSVSSTEEPSYKIFNVYMYKQNDEYGYSRLLNAEYTLSYYDIDMGYGGADASIPDLSSAKPVRSWVFRSREGKDADGKKAAVIDFAEDKPVRGGDMYSVRGYTVLPDGVFTLKETKAPVGVGADQTTYKGMVRQPANGKEPILVFNGSEIMESADLGTSLRLINSEPPKSVLLKLQKVDMSSGLPVPEGSDRKYSKGSLAGAVYEVYMEDTDYPQDVKVGEIITNEDGYGELYSDSHRDGKQLKAGRYYIKEKKASPGYVVDSITTEEKKGVYEDGRHLVTARLDESSDKLIYEFEVLSADAHHETVIHKTDITTGSEIEGARLQIINSDGEIADEWVSGSEPHEILALPDGKYTLREITAPYGYDVAEDAEFEVKADIIKNTVEMKNKPVTIGTTALDDETGSHIGTFKKDEVITDSVRIKGLYPGRQYKVSGTLVEKSTGKPLSEKAGVPVSSEKVFTAAADEMTVELQFKVDSSVFTKEMTLVAFEKLYRMSEVHEGDEIPAELQKHENKDDEDQSVHYGGIASTVAAGEGSGSHNLLASGDSVIIDTVKYSNLSVRDEYTLKGELFDKTTGKLTGIKAETVFTPDDPDGTVEVRFRADTSGLKNHSLVVFESLWAGKRLIDEHHDREDKDQTVNIPEIRTIAVNPGSGEHIACAGDNLTIKDTVTYSNLEAGRKYTLRATVNYKAGLLNQLHTVSNGGEAITAETEFTPSKTDGTETVTLTFNGYYLAGRRIVIFEELIDGDCVIAEHKDINDEDQSVYLPEIRTKAGKKEGKYVTDTVSYSNLIPGLTYRAKGYFVRKSDGKRIEGSDGETLFTPDNPDGTVEVRLKPGSGSEQLVAFESVFLVKAVENSGNESAESEILVGEHKDINDRAQTYSPVKSPKTGDDNHLKVYIIVTALSAYVLFLTGRLRKRKIR